MMLLVVLVGCGTGDPCSWAHGSWEQEAVVVAGEDVGGDSGQSLVLSPDAFEYVATAEPWSYVPEDPECSSLRASVGDRSYRIEKTGEELTLRLGTVRA
ncbi:MAG TPA: hypothetical protein QGF58_24195, partial [Myxococcota bacterium]|nr:hypothetical protein [Myxococcota bacterium]